METVNFAQISDIHISALGDHHDMLSGQSVGFFTNVVSEINQNDSLDFVLISGDLLDTAQQWELEQIQQIIDTLNKPYYIIPGNHDRRDQNATEGLTRHQFAQHFNPQVSARPTEPDAQAGYWSIAVSPSVQLIGLDSIRDEDWGGHIDSVQMDWLKQELKNNADKLVVVTVHHPLHKLAPIDSNPDWLNFVCYSGPELLELFDNNPQVKLVLTGHHHQSKADMLGQRLHLACPALAIYPCAYRTISLEQQSDGGWQIEWRLHHTTDEATVAVAFEKMLESWQKVGFSVDFVEQIVLLALGTPYDGDGTAIL